MRNAICSGVLAALALAGCSQQESASSNIEALDVSEEAPAAASAEAPAVADSDPARATPADAAGGEIKVAAAPRIAYTYQFGYRLDADAIGKTQRAHADLCEKAGPTTCRIINLSSAGGEGDYASARLELDVAAPKARPFAADLGKAVESAGGEEVNASITGEDLSKQIVDTEARLRARLVLRDRLMEVLQSRKGTVAELVEAERGVAAVNEEIDQARSWLAEMQGRVDFSRMTIEYQSGSVSSGGFFSPIREAFNSIGSVLGSLIAGLILLTVVLIPLTLFGWGIWRIVRWVRGKTAKVAPEQPAVETA